MLYVFYVQTQKYITVLSDGKLVKIYDLIQIRRKETANPVRQSRKFQLLSFRVYRYLMSSLVKVLEMFLEVDSKSEGLSILVVITDDNWMPLSLDRS